MRALIGKVGGNIVRGTEKHPPMSEFWKGPLEYAILSVRSNSIGIHVRFGYGSSVKIQLVPLCLLVVAIIGVNVSIMHSFLLAFCHREYFTVVFSDIYFLQKRFSVLHE